MYIGWCDGVQACDGNTAHVTRCMPRAETPAVWTGSLDAPRVQVIGLRTEACRYDHNKGTCNLIRLFFAGFFQHIFFYGVTCQFGSGSVRVRAGTWGMDLASVGGPLC